MRRFVIAALMLTACSGAGEQDIPDAPKGEAHVWCYVGDRTILRTDYVKIYRFEEGRLLLTLMDGTWLNLPAHSCTVRQL